MAIVQEGTAVKAMSGPLLELEQVAVQTTRPFPGDTSASDCPGSVFQDGGHAWGCQQAVARGPFHLEIWTT